MAWLQPQGSVVVWPQPGLPPQVRGTPLTPHLLWEQVAVRTSRLQECTRAVPAGVSPALSAPVCTQGHTRSQPSPSGRPLCFTSGSCSTKATGPGHLQHHPAPTTSAILQAHLPAAVTTQHGRPTEASQHFNHVKHRQL